MGTMIYRAFIYQYNYYNMIVIFMSIGTKNIFLISK